MSLVGSGVGSISGAFPFIRHSMVTNSALVIGLFGSKCVSSTPFVMPHSYAHATAFSYHAPTGTSENGCLLDAAYANTVRTRMIVIVARIVFFVVITPYRSSSN